MLFQRLAGLIGALVVFTMASGSGALAQETKIIGFGDSLMAGYELSAGEGYTGQLEAALAEAGIEAEVVNAAVSGDTTSGGLARIDWSVPDDADLVLLELGGNDMLRGIDPAIVRQNIDTMLARLQERDIPVVLFGMRATPSLGADYVERFEAVFADLAEQYDAAYVPFFLDSVIDDPSKLLDDRIHPNPEGVAIMVENTLPAIREAIEELPATN